MQHDAPMPDKTRDLSDRLQHLLTRFQHAVPDIPFGWKVWVIGVSAVVFILELLYLTGTNTDILQKLMASIALVVGALWVLMNYDRNRTHIPRLQVEVKAGIIKRENRQYLLVTCQAKNVGLSSIELTKPQNDGVGRAGSALRVRRFDQWAGPRIVEVPWEKEDEASLFFAIFTNHDTIEPGLTVSEQKLIYLPEKPIYLPDWKFADWSYDAYEV
jgi:hypothetical protein